MKKEKEMERAAWFSVNNSRGVVLLEPTSERMFRDLRMNSGRLGPNSRDPDMSVGMNFRFERIVSWFLANLQTSFD